MRLMHGAWVAATDRAEAAAELVAELAMPDRALRRAVRMRGVAAMIYDRIDRKRSSRPGCVPKKKMDHADLERLCELNMREYNFGIPLSDGELQEQRRLRDMLAAHDGDR